MIQRGFLAGQLGIKNLHCRLLRFNLCLLGSKLGINLLKLRVECGKELFVGADFFFVGGNFEPVVVNSLTSFRAALSVIANALLMPIAFVFELVVATDGIANGAFDFVERPAQFSNLRFATGNFANKLFGARRNGGDFRFEIGNVGVEQIKLVPLESSVENLEFVENFFVPARFTGLALERNNLALHFLDDIGQPHQILLGVFELAERFFFLMLVFANTGGFFKNHPPVVGMRAENLVNLTLRHHRIARTPDTGIHEHLLNVPEPALSFVEQIFAGAVPVNPARHGDFSEIKIDARQGNEFRINVSKSQIHFRHPDGFATFGAVENHVGHFGAAQRLGGLFTKYPADGIGDIGLTTTIRTNDRGYAR